MTKKNIDIIARQVVAFTKAHIDNSELTHLKKRLKENEKATQNLIRALEQGNVTDIITEQLQIRKNEKRELDIQIAKEEIKHPALTVNQVKFFMDKFIKGDVNDLKYRRSLINILVRKIYVIIKEKSP